MIASIQAGEKLANELLRGRFIDHYIVTSCVVVIALQELPIAHDRPSCMWLQFLCDARVTDSNTTLYTSAEPSEQAALVGRLHGLIGHRVDDVAIIDGNVLSVMFESTRLELIPDKNESRFDVAWQAASDYPDLAGTSKWVVAADGDGDLIVRAPKVTVTPT
jgi:hypothetical protein